MTRIKSINIYRVELASYRSLKRKYHRFLDKINFYQMRKKTAYDKGNYDFISDYEIKIADLRIDLKLVTIRLKQKKNTVKYMADCLSSGLELDSVYNKLLDTKNNDK